MQSLVLIAMCVFQCTCSFEHGELSDDINDDTNDDINELISSRKWRMKNESVDN